MLRYLNTWFPVGGPVWVGLKVVAFAGGSVSLRVDLGVSKAMHHCQVAWSASCL